MTDQPEPVAGAGSTPTPDAAGSLPTPAPAAQPPTPAAQPPAQGAWGTPLAAPQPPPAAPSQGTWGTPPAAVHPQPFPAQPAPAPWGAQPVAPGQPTWVGQPVPPPQPGWGTPAPGAPAGWVPGPAVQGGWGTPPPGPPGGWVPGPAAAPRRRGTSGKVALGVLAIIIGVVFGANLVNAALPLPKDPVAVDPGPAFPQDPGLPQQTQAPQPTQDPGNPQETSIPIETLPPFETTPPAETAAPVDPGPINPGASLDIGAGFLIFPPDGWSVVGGSNGLTVLQKSGVLLVTGGLPWTGTPTELATGYRDAWFAEGQFTGDDPQAGSIGNGIPAAGLNYTGVIDGSQVDGAIITGATGGSGVLFNFFGASGSLKGVSSDLDLILKTVQHTGG